MQFALLVTSHSLLGKRSRGKGFLRQGNMPFVRGHLLSCKLLLILYHPELRGGLIELGIAFAYGIPIWLTHHRGETVSSSALGCANRVLEYETLEDLKQMTLNMLSSSAEL
jgi:hypothetical protein